MSRPQILIITNSILPYATHNISHLALPNGFTYHFRYRAQYLKPAQWWGDQRNWSANLQDKTGLLVLRDWARGSFIPLREIKVHGVQHYGEFVFLNLELLNYVAYPKLESTPDSSEVPTALPETYQSLRERYDESIRTLIPDGIQNEPEQHLSSLVIGLSEPVLDIVYHENISSFQTAPALPRVIECDRGSNLQTTLLFWDRIITLIGQLPAFQGMSFYRIARLTSTNDPSIVLDPRDLSDRQKGYKLTSGQSYILSVLQTIPFAVEDANLPFAMEIESNGQHVVPMRKEEIVDGVYDELTFYFNTVPQSKSKTLSFISLQSSQQPNSSKAPSAWLEGTIKDHVRVPANLIPIEIIWTTWTWIWRKVIPPVAVIVALVLWVVAEQIIKAIPLLGQLGVTIEIVRYLAVFLLAFAFQSWSAFTGQFKVISETKP